VKGRKRHIVTDTLGLMLSLCVQPANVQDRDGGLEVAASAKAKHPSIKKLFTDSGYAGECARKMRDELKIEVEVVRRSEWQGPNPVEAEVPGKAGFRIQPKRWVVERTHAWTDRVRRMAKDFDQLMPVHEAWIWLVQARLLMRRLARP